MGDSGNIPDGGRARAVVRRGGRRWRSLPPPVRAVTVLVAGGLVLLAGVAMLVLPGPGLLVIALALGLLATEFMWARRLVDRGRALVRQCVETIRGRRDVTRR